MQTDSTIAPEAHAFDPVDWLKTFEAVGGGYVLSDEAAHFGFAVCGRSEVDQRAARQMIAKLAGKEQKALVDHLRRQEAERLIELLGPDLAIQAAWERRQAAYRRYNALPHDDLNESFDPETHMTASERECWAIIDAAEAVIEETPASTPRAVAIKLWSALYHCVTGREDDEAITSGDIERVGAIAEDLDWNAKLIVSAIRSLEAMEAQS